VSDRPKRKRPRRPGWTLLGGCLLGLVVMASGCGPRSPHGASATSRTPITSRTTSIGNSLPVGSGAADGVVGLTGAPPPWPCSGWANAGVTAYDRASTAARVFGTLQPGDPVAVVARDVRGWLAFSPGTAQAANVGPFRLRWLPPDAPVRLEGSCSDLPVRVSPPPGVCFEMAMAATPILTAPDASASTLVVLAADSYVAVTGSSPSGWLRVDAGSGSVPASGTGWIAPEAVNVNGPCDPFLKRGGTP